MGLDTTLVSFTRFMQSYLDTPIEFLKGIGPVKAELLRKELGISTYEDLLYHYPFRYEDRSNIVTVARIRDDQGPVLLQGVISGLTQAGHGRKKRLSARLKDDTGAIELVWFKGINWVISKVVPGVEYRVYGRPKLFGGRFNIPHPEINPVVHGRSDTDTGLTPVYSTTEKLKNKYLDSRAIGRALKTLMEMFPGRGPETIPDKIRSDYGLIQRNKALQDIHFPPDGNSLKKALYRLKFEEFFFIQMKLLSMKVVRTQKNRGKVYQDAKLLTDFYEHYLPFELTGAQKNVIREIYRDMKSGNQMNRLLQGDVGSGKTIVAFICMLLVIGEDAQAALMAPTEILAIQHFNGLSKYAGPMGLRIALLTGSTKASEKKTIRRMLNDGDIHLIVGTHALIEDTVKFKELGLAIVDEQHRFGVAQRSKLWQKNQSVFPHVLVMTATPIPRTLAMTLYGDLDVSTIDELPKGRRPIRTVHRYDAHRLKVNGFLREEIAKGRQIYMVYPLIEESEKMDLKDLMDGYESVCRAFPDLVVSIVHGKMPSEAKEYEMQRFVKGETKIMVATTVIEVGVDVPNASVMVIENAERFGLAQLHQLRGRVGRGAEQSYCVLMTRYELSKDARVRIETMVRTTNGFEIADVDLSLRGPGDLTGTQQSGIVDLKIADLSKDGKILQAAREAAGRVLSADPHLRMTENAGVREQMKRTQVSDIDWSEVG